MRQFGFYRLSLICILFFFVASSVLRANSSDAEDPCVEALRTFAPHLFYQPKEGEPALNGGIVGGKFNVSYFANHPAYRRVPTLVGADSGKRFRAEWEIKGDQKNIHYHFLFEAFEPGPQPQLNVHFSREHPEVFHLRTHFWKLDGKTLDLNLLAEAVSVLHRQTSTGTIWNVDVNDENTLEKLWVVMQKQIPELFIGSARLEEDAKGGVVALIPSVTREDRLFLENDLVDADRGDEFQEEAYAAIYRSQWFRTLCMSPDVSGFQLKLIPVIHKKFWAGGDAISFKLRVFFR